MTSRARGRFALVSSLWSQGRPEAFCQGVDVSQRTPERYTSIDFFCVNLSPLPHHPSDQPVHPTMASQEISNIEANRANSEHGSSGLDRKNSDDGVITHTVSRGDEQKPLDPKLQAALANIDERKLMRKVDLHLIPWLSVLYLASFLDRSAVSLMISQA